MATPGEPAPSDAIRQISFSGTPSYMGLSRPDDYVPEMADPVRRMSAFEEMRFSDDGIHAAIAAREHMIAASNWMVTSAADDPKSVEIKQFVEDNLYPFLDDILNKLAGALQYGFGSIEPVYAWSDSPARKSYIVGGVQKTAQKFTDRRIVLNKIAHPRQRTVFTFRLNGTGDIVAIEQYGWDGFTFRRNLIPPHKLVMWTYKRQGDDYWGVPPTRHAYKAWTFKKQLEAVNLLGADRFGAGTPVGEAGPGWTDADYGKLETYLKTWRVAEESYLIHPAGGKITLMSGDGSMTLAILDWVKYYKLCIAMTYLTQGSELGNTGSGSRALGEVMLEQTETIVQSDVEALASLINEQIIINLVDWNYGKQDVYPQFVPSQRVRASSALGTIIGTLITQGAIKWEPKDEQWLRDAMHLPSIDLEARQTLYDEEQKNALAIAQNGGVDPNAPALGPDGKPVAGKVVGSIGGKPRPKPDPATIERSSQTKQKALALDTSNIAIPTSPNAPGGATYRTAEYSQWENGILRPVSVTRDLDIATARLTGEVHAALQAIDTGLVSQLTSYAEKGADSLTAGVRKLAVPSGDRGKLRKVMLAAATRARSYGADAVSLEAARQAGNDPSSYVPTRPKFTLTSDPQNRDRSLAAEVDRAVEDEVARREAAIRSAALLALHMAGSLTPADLLAQATAAAHNNLDDLSVYRLEANMQRVVNVGFGVGRQDGADALGSDIKAKVYSAVMDGGSCQQCAAYDGAVYPPDYPEDATGVQAPNPKCDGTLAHCRCVWVYVTNAEVPSEVAGTRGTGAGGLAAQVARGTELSGLLAATERTTAMLERHLDASAREASKAPPVINITTPPVNVAAPVVTVNMPTPEPRRALEGSILRDGKATSTIRVEPKIGLEGTIDRGDGKPSSTIRIEELT